MNFHDLNTIKAGLQYQQDNPVRHHAPFSVICQFLVIGGTLAFIGMAFAMIFLL